MAASASGGTLSAVSRARRFQQLWYADGLTFACTQCGKCCYGASQRQITLNEAEQQAAADHLGIGKTDFANRFIIPGTDRLQANESGACKLLDGGKCSIHPARPTQCATYPFWGPHLASAVDWKVAASQCEGISSHQSHLQKPEHVPTKEQSLRLIEEFRASPQAGHGVAQPGKITPTQVVKALIMNEIHAAGEYPETSQKCEKMLGAALEETELRGIIDELSSAQRTVVHSDDHITVLDSRFDNHWQRDVVLNSCLGHTQSCVTLTPGPNGELQADHSQLPDSTPVFQMLAACVAGLQGLRDLRHPNAPKLQTQRSSQNQQASLDSTARQVGTINVAVIGAGACSVPAHLTHGNDNVFVQAVDIDKRMLEAAKNYMGVKESKHLKMFHADGLDFIRSDFNSCTRGVQGYDIIILDVALPAQAHGGDISTSVLAPAPEFLGDRFLGDAVWRRLRPDGMLMVNALGPDDHLQKIKKALTRHARVFRWHQGEGDTNVLLAFPLHPPSPESEQLEAWDNVWGSGDVKHWDPKRVSVADISRTFVPCSSQETPVIQDFQVLQAKTSTSISSVEGCHAGTEP